MKAESAEDVSKFAVENQPEKIDNKVVFDVRCHCVKPASFWAEHRRLLL